MDGDKGGGHETLTPAFLFGDPAEREGTPPFNSQMWPPWLGTARLDV